MWVLSGESFIFEGLSEMNAKVAFYGDDDGNRMENKSIKFNLIENGLDFVLSSVRLTMESKSDTDHKYSMLHLSAGVELILKARLELEDWTYLFEHIKKATKEGLMSGDFVSTKLETALKRLEEFGVEINSEDIRLINDLKKRRNKIEHFQFHESVLGLKSILSEVLNFLFKFINNELENSENSKLVTKQIKELRLNLVKLSGFIEVRQKELNPVVGELDKESIAIQCPNCYQKYLILTSEHNDKIECLFCLKKGTPEDLAFDYLENILHYSHYSSIKDGGEFPLFKCPECEMDSMIQTEEHYLCFNCCKITFFENIDECSRCGEKFYSNEDGLSICKDCWAYGASRL